MQAIIDAISKDTLKAELNQDTFVRKANYGDNEIYIVNQHNSPNTLQEIGRLRELSFRAAGGGTGLACDLDEFDISENCYEQLVVWDPVEEQIVGGYRFILGNKVIKDNGEIELATTELFQFSNTFIKEYLPYTIELGRSFVQPEYQPSINNRKGIFSLDNLWDGLGALVVQYPEMKHFFGKITMYTHFDAEARDLILYFMNCYFPDKEDLIVPFEPLGYKTDISAHKGMFDGLEYKEGHKLLNQFVRKQGENIPPLVNAYMNLSATMKSFGTCINHGFGGVEETGILVTIADIYESKKLRHVGSYQPA